MQRTSRYRGFSLTEVLMAIGTLAVGMLFIGGTLAVAVHLSFASNDQVMGSLVARDALAKLRLYGINYDLLPDRITAEVKYIVYTHDVMLEQPDAQFGELYTYTVRNGVNDIVEKQYYEHVLCRQNPWRDRLIDVALFIVRADQDLRTELVKVEVTVQQGSDRITLVDLVENPLFHGAHIVDDASGQVYRVFQTSDEDKMRLDQPWPGLSGEVWVWTVKRLDNNLNPLLEVRTTQIPR